MKSCNDCVRSWQGRDGKVHCGAGVVDPVPDNIESNPAWAVMKYSNASIINLILGKPSDTTQVDCENVNILWANGCAVYEARS